MMETFTGGIDKIYYDLDNIEDLNSRLQFETSFKDIGKAVKPHVLPWATAAALGAGIYSYTKDMSNQDKFNNASAVYQFTVIDSRVDADESAKSFVQFALTLPKKDRQRLHAQLDEFKSNLPSHKKGRMDEFQQHINYWVNQFNIDRWSKRDDSQAPTPLPPPEKKSPWEPGSDKPPGWEDPRGFRVKEKNNMKTFETFESEVSNWVTENTGQASAYADTWLHDHRDELETADEGIGIEDVIDRIADDYADEVGAQVDNEAAQEIVSVVVPALTNDYGWVLDPNSDILSRYIAVDEAKPTGLPGRVEGEPWIHSDDVFLEFLEWLLKKEWTSRQIVDVVSEPRKYEKEYAEFLDHKQRQEQDPLL